MKKDFDNWNTKKKLYDAIQEFPRPKRRQIWWCVVGENIGSEQGCNEGFERPVLVVKVFGSIFWGIPITSSDPEGKKDENPLYFKIEDIPYLDNEGKQKTLEGFLALHQLRAYDSRRLLRRILKMEMGLFDIIIRKVKEYL